MSSDANSIMSTAPKAVAHLRSQQQRKRLGLIFGSGASNDLGFPQWHELVTRIASDDEVQARDLLARFQANESGQPPNGSLTKSLASITQLLFSHFRDKCINSQSLEGSLTFLQEQKIKTSWLKIIHKNLYRDVSPDARSDTIKHHPYLTSFGGIIKNSPLTVNYNFDDTLEKLLLISRDEDEEVRTRGYEVVDKPNAQFQKDNSVIYHPNGFLPSVFQDGASAEVVFSDEAFQDRLISAATGKYVHLSNHLFRNTCLLIGLSLEDTTLQNLLRQNAVSNPGHIHYIIHYLQPDAELDVETRQLIFRSNFSSYNLYTLFLTGQGIGALAQLILMGADRFKLQHPEARKKFVYYVVGSIGSGKTSSVGNFRNLITYDEWIDERKPELAVPESEVPPSSVDEMNSWIQEQFRKKNFAVFSQPEGVHYIDRCPLDPLTFGPSNDRVEKAKNLVNKITDHTARQIEPGHIIHLDCGIEELRIRNSLKHKFWPDEELQKLLNAIDEVYGNINRSVICTRGRTIGEVAREIAKVIFLEEYKPVDIQAQLTKFAQHA